MPHLHPPNILTSNLLIICRDLDGSLGHGLRVSEPVIDFFTDVDRRGLQMARHCLVRLLKQIRKPLGIGISRYCEKAGGTGFE
jgi:hypothetical protein